MFVPCSFLLRSFPVAIEAKEERSKYVHYAIKNNYNKYHIRSTLSLRPTTFSGRKNDFFAQKFWLFRSKLYFCLNFGIARMTDEEKKLLSTFETQLRHLIFLHDELRRENAALKQELNAKEDECQKVQADFRELEQRYTDLKTATTISLNGSDVRETKLRLSKLVREVDKCIALLNE